MFDSATRARMSLPRGALWEEEVDNIWEDRKQTLPGAKVDHTRIMFDTLSLRVE